MSEVNVSLSNETDEQTIFEVQVLEGTSQTLHTVIVDKPYYQELTKGQIPIEVFVEQSFQFLLQRESKEAILSEFNIAVISQYFPEYESQTFS